MTVTEVEQTLDWVEIEDMDWSPLAGSEGVSTKTLWRDPAGISSAGLMRIEPDAILATHTHRFAVHHLLIIEGTLRVGQRWLRAGGYAYVPAGAPHGVDEVGPNGCVLFFNYLSLADFN